MKRESSLLYVPVDTLIAVAAKTRRFKLLAYIQNDPNGHIYIINLNLYAGQLALDGNLGPMDAMTLANICAWSGDPGLLEHAMIVSGIIEKNEAGETVISDWQDGAGKAYVGRLNWRKQKAEQRKKHQAEYGAVPPDVPGVVDARGSVPEPGWTTPPGPSIRPSVLPPPVVSGAQHPPAQPHAQIQPIPLPFPGPSGVSPLSQGHLSSSGGTPQDNGTPPVGQPRRVLPIRRGVRSKPNGSSL